MRISPYPLKPTVNFAAKIQINRSDFEELNNIDLGKGQRGPNYSPYINEIDAGFVTLKFDRGDKGMEIKFINHALFKGKVLYDCETGKRVTTLD